MHKLLLQSPPISAMIAGQLARESVQALEAVSGNVEQSFSWVRKKFSLPVKVPTRESTSRVITVVPRSY